MGRWDAVKENNKLKNAAGVDLGSIGVAEKKLGVNFSPEYKEFLLQVGACIYENHEILGLSQVPYLKVVERTTDAREISDVPDNWYLIEDAGIDGILIWQDEAGYIYQTAPNGTQKKIANSLQEYLGLSTEQTV